MKYLNVICFLSLLVVENVFGLQCFSTDLKTLKEKGVVEHHVSDCNDYTNDPLHKLGWTGGQNLPDRCFKVAISGSAQEIKGCGVNGGCGVLKETFKTLGPRVSNSINECYECEENNCNAGNPGAKIATGALIVLAAILLL